ncbi:hypothetical protein BV898_08892 [Hypsibius exemplaris]|uniref:Uncharacterized protein n=1 Tax=Hypsibius exemplaris TaxID=2072580 RepID=A0A1W0WP98_HYPEX|nr:hypothetical protein BV898_08892 [Hypsibius exemplaris]
MWAILAILAVGSFGGASAAIVPAIFNSTTTNTSTVLTKPIIAAAAPVVFAANVTAANVTAAPIFIATTTVSPWANLTVVDYFIKVIRGELIGAKKCKKDHDCGAGLKCNLLWNWCAPWDAPIWPEFANNCTSNANCSDLYYCNIAFGKCKIGGPRKCLTTQDCMWFAGDNKTIWNCIDIEDLEKRAVLFQLGRPTFTKKSESHHKSHHKKHDHHHEEEHEVDIESEEVAKFGATAEGDHLMHGKRCWSRCTLDADCESLRFPAFLIKENYGCCNGYCTRRQSCVSVPQNFRAANATIAF